MLILALFTLVSFMPSLASALPRGTARPSQHLSPDSPPPSAPSASGTTTAPVDSASTSATRASFPPQTRRDIAVRPATRSAGPAQDKPNINVRPAKEMDLGWW